MYKPLLLLLGCIWPTAGKWQCEILNLRFAKTFFCPPARQPTSTTTALLVGVHRRFLGRANFTCARVYSA